ncbi:MAG: hypothetical protein J6C23_03590 [Clostridia bacterium]|nr:hypothetical protein [Clostridia bacterium]
MSKIVKFIIGLVITLVLICGVLVLVGHFVLVGLFGDNGSVLKLGVKGYTDVFDVYTAITSPAYKVDSENVNSAENGARLNEEFAKHTVHNHIFDDLTAGDMIDFGSVNINDLSTEEKDYLSFYAGLSEYSAPVVLDGGMNAISLDFILQNDFITSKTNMEFHVKGVEISSESSQKGEIRVIFEVEREEIIRVAGLDVTAAGFIRQFLHEKLTLTLDVFLSLQDGQLVQDDLKVALNSASYAQSILLVRLANTYEEGMFEQFGNIITEFINLPTECKAITGADNRVSDISFEGNCVVYTHR